MLNTTGGSELQNKQKSSLFNAFWGGVAPTILHDEEGAGEGRKAKKSGQGLMEGMMRG